MHDKQSAVISVKRYNIKVVDTVNIQTTLAEWYFLDQIKEM